MPPAPSWRPIADRVITGCGWLVATGLGVAAGVYEAFYTPMFIGGTRAPIAAAAALICNPAIAWFAAFVTRRDGAGAAPALAWCAVWFLAVRKSTEGDWVVYPNNWVALATLTVGALSFAAAIYVLRWRGQAG